jgi:hypothetical protein
MSFGRATLAERDIADGKGAEIVFVETDGEMIYNINEPYQR